MSLEKNGINQETGLPESVRDEDHRLLPLTQQAQIWPNSPISHNTYYDTSPTSPGTYYTTIHSTSSRRYTKQV